MAAGLRGAPAGAPSGSRGSFRSPACSWRRRAPPRSASSRSRRQTFQREATADVLSAGAPSQFSDQILQRFNLRERFKREPEAALAELRSTLDTEGGENRLFALAELSYLHAEQAQARSHYLAAAIYAYAFLFRGEDQPGPGPLDPRTRIAADLYNRALTEGLTGPDRNAVVVAPGEYPIAFGRLEIAMPAGPPMWAGRRLENFLPATHVAIRGLRNRYRKAGIGAPLVAGLTAVEDVEVHHRFIPPRLKVPVTVFLRLDAVRAGISSGELRGTLEVYTKDTATTTTVEGRAVPLEFEPSAALAYTLNDAPVWESEIRGFLYGNFLKSGWALYALSPVSPGTRARRPDPRDGLQSRALGRSRQRARGGSADRVAGAVLALRLQHGQPVALFGGLAPRVVGEEPWRSWIPRARTAPSGGRS